MMGWLMSTALPYIVALVLGVVALIGDRWSGRKDERERANRAALEAQKRADDNARDSEYGAIEAMKAGKTPQQVKEGNDARWRK